MTGNGLRVEAPVRRIVVFGCAGGTHCKLRHAGVSAVVRYPLNGAQTRTAVCAVGEGIAEAAREGIEDLLHTRCAGRGVGSYAGADRRSLACGNVKSRILRQVSGGFSFDAIDARQRWGLARQLEHEFLDGGDRATDVDAYTLAVVGDPTPQSMTVRQTPHRRTETDSLDQAAHANEFGRFVHGAINSGANGQSNTRLLPESAITPMPLWTPMPYGHDRLSRVGDRQPLSPLALNSNWPVRARAGAPL